MNEFVGFSTVKSTLYRSHASITLLQKLYNAFADATRSLLTPLRFGRPSGQRELLNGLGEGTPCLLSFFLMGIFLALLEVPQGGPRCTPSTRPEATSSKTMV